MKKNTSLTSEFQVMGWFYGSRKKLRRRVLDIKLQVCISSVPDLLVIMMNPGESEPRSWKNAFNQFVEASPDNTQRKIMGFMKNHEFNYVRVLNLSDICEIHSPTFYKQIDPNVKRNKHSIFCPDNEEALNSVFIKGIPVLIAWGVEPLLLPLAEAALAQVKIFSSFYFGDRKGTSETQYYHPQKRETPNFKNFRSWSVCVNEAYFEVRRKLEK